MGTRATVKFYRQQPSETVKPLVACYYQYDGYYEGVGQELADFLKDKKIINGIGGEKMEEGFANGIDCLAAQFIANQKTEIGGFYITALDDEQGYDYDVYLKDGKLTMKIDEFEGEPKDFKDWTLSRGEE